MPLDAAEGVAYTALHAIATVLTPVGGAVTAIVVFTLAVRMLLSPLSFAQARAQRAQAALAPQLRQLQQRHQGDPARLMAAQRELYRSERVSPLTGCLPALAQAPFFLVMYRVFKSHDLAAGSTALPGHALLRVPLDQTWAAVAGAGLLSGPSLVFVGLLALLTALAWWSGRRATTLAGTTSRLARILPFGSVLFAATVPLAVGLYLLTSSAYTAAESLLLRRTPPAPRRRARQRPGSPRRTQGGRGRVRRCRVGRRRSPRARPAAAATRHPSKRGASAPRRARSRRTAS